jgi:hypothetical protein
MGNLMSQCLPPTNTLYDQGEGNIHALFVNLQLQVRSQKAALWKRMLHIEGKDFPYSKSRERVKGRRPMLPHGNWKSRSVSVLHARPRCVIGEQNKVVPEVRIDRKELQDVEMERRSDPTLTGFDSINQRCRLR